MNQKLAGAFLVVALFSIAVDLYVVFALLNIKSSIVNISQMCENGLDDALNHYDVQVK